ncbi:MAG TPA: UvrD-helicase domain-containing protein, partial [Candidatus Eisenbacteria bacterium]|nr:UvrD-helicase domain-containing protein [Candidatus Eisenbacteria bacterium]
ERKDSFKAGTPNAEEMQETAKQALKLLSRLHKVDESLIRDLMEILRPFAIRIREYVRREGVLTFDDLLILARDLLRDVPSVRHQERGRFATVLVDEFQDTDPIQYDIVFFLCGTDKPEERNPYQLPLEADRLFIVGDPKQSIYRFRGADMSAYDRAVTHVLEHGTGISLSTSYRSRPEVLEPLNTLFRRWIGAIQNRSIEPDYQDIAASRDAAGNEPGVEIWSILTPEDAPVGTRRKAEAREIAGRIHEWLAGEMCRPRDIALLFRALTDAPIYMRALREAGIEFVLEGGRAFFERPEIVEAFALLGAVANPADPVALIGVLRSGFGGASDQELAQHAERGEPWRWTSDTGTGTVHDTFARLRDLDAKRRTLPLDRWIQWVLVESPFALAQIAHVDGPQRLANLRKLATKAGTLVRDRGLTLSETLRVLEEAFAGERVEGESPLADESLDVVRLTTIHKAKGLEFGIVIVPDLARRTQEPPSGTRVCRFTYQTDTYLAVEVADRERTRNLAEVFRAEDQRTHDEAEAKRLLYVATTRARDRVILVNSATSSRVAWMNGLAQVGYVLTGKTFPAPGWLGESRVWHRVCEERDVAPRPAPRELSLATHAYRSFQTAAEMAAQTGPPRFRNPSLDHLLLATDKDESEDTGLLTHSPDLARAVGVTVHRVLETWNFEDGDAWRERLPSIAERTARELGISRPEELEREASSILAGFASSSLPTYLKEVEILGREVPILWRDPDGATVIGYADLIYRASGNVHIADYKTDADARPAHAALYRPQLADYACAVERALSLEAPPITEVIFVRKGTRVVL